MRALVLLPDRNSHGKKDLTGAFKPKAIQFAKHHDLAPDSIVSIDVGRPLKKRKEQVLEAISQSSDLDCIAFFCHGWANGIQLGFSFPKNPKTRNQVTAPMDVLAAEIAEATDRTDIRIPLYCCSTADSKVKGHVAGDGGFADEFRDALCRAGLDECRVVGHTTAGHTTDNPHVRLFDGNGFSIGGTGGYWVSRPGGPTWRNWKRYLRKGGWKDLPFDEVEDIRWLLT